LSRLFKAPVFWIILAMSVLLSLLLALDVSPWLRGGFGWRWQYAAPALRQVWPFLTLTAVYTGAIILLERHLQRPTLLVPTLLAFALVTVLMQMAVLHVTNPSPLSELFRRTVSPNSGGFFNVTVQVGDVGTFLRDFPRLMPAWPAHPQRHPPGVPLIFLGWRGLLERLPAVGDTLARVVRPDQCNNYNLMFFSNTQLASAWIGMLLPGLAAVLVWPVYKLGQGLYDWRVGWRAAAWVPLLPALIVFVPQWDQFYPVLTTLAVLSFWAGMKRRSLALIFASGVLMSISTFLSLTNLIVLGVLGFFFVFDGTVRYRSQERSYPKPVASVQGASQPSTSQSALTDSSLSQVTGASRIKNRVSMLLDAAIFALGLATCWLAYWLLTGVTPVDIWQVASAVHLELERPYWPWLALHLQDFFSFGGWILAGLFVLGFLAAAGRWREAPREGWGLPLALGLSLVFLDLSGVSRAEVSRVWLPYLPLMAVGAAATLRQIKKPRASFGFATAALALNLLVVGAYLRPLDAQMVDPPRLPPGGPVSNVQPVEARFGDLAYLEGYRLTSTVAEDGQPAVEIVLNWRALARSDRVYYVFVPLVAADGARVAQSDDIPARQAYPTTCWQAGQRLSDSHLLILPPDLPPGAYNMQVGLYLLDSGERLAAFREGAPQADFVQVDRVLVIDE
jgi:hypothetical protein